ncbi:MAG: hypothetical protein AB7G21_00975 [Dehalococcoidia bacterium]
MINRRPLLLALALLLALVPIEARAQAVPPGQGQVPPPHIVLTVEYPGGRTTVEGTGEGASIAVPPDAPVRLTLDVDSDVSIYDRPFVILREQDGPGIARSFTPVTTVTYDLPVEGRHSRLTLVGEMRLFVRDAQGVTAVKTIPLTLRFTPGPRVLAGTSTGVRTAVAAGLVVALAGATWALARRRGALRAF